jgi:hypothetical protein
VSDDLLAETKSFEDIEKFYNQLLVKGYTDLMLLDYNAY